MRGSRMRTPPVVVRALGAHGRPLFLFVRSVSQIFKTKCAQVSSRLAFSLSLFSRTLLPARSSHIRSPFARPLALSILL
jgi:hypothetical protein